MQRPEIKEITNISIFEPQHIRLDNGVPVDVIDLGEQPVSRLDIAFEGGRCDDRNQTISEFVSAILREGSKSRNAKEIAGALDFYGAWFGCDASSHNVTLSLYSLNRNFENVIPILAEIVMEPSFPEHELSNLKQLAVNRLNTNKGKVSFLAMEKFAQLHFGDGSNLGKAVTASSIESITSDELKKFRHKWLTPQNMRITISGKVSQQMIASINQFFGQSHKSGDFLTSVSDRPSVQFRPGTVIVNKNEALQSAIRMGLPAIRRSDNDYIPLRILVTALGGYFGSRLMTNIREDKGYTYGISSSLLGYRDTSFISISSQCDTAYSWQVVKEIKSEMTRLQIDKIPDDELKRLKTYMLSDLSRTLDTPFSIADYYASIHNNHIPNDYFRRQVEIINSITASELLDIAQRHLSVDGMLAVIAGNAALLRNDNA